MDAADPVMREIHPGEHRRIDLVVELHAGKTQAADRFGEVREPREILPGPHGRERGIEQGLMLIFDRQGREDLQQLAQIVNIVIRDEIGMMALVPRKILGIAVYDNLPKAGLLSRLDIAIQAVANVGAALRPDLHPASGLQEDRRVRFAYADITGQNDGLKTAG